MIVRDACESDLPAIFAILNYEVLNTVNTFKLEEVIESGQKDWWEAHQDERYPVLVAIDSDDGLLGWASLSAWSLTHGGYARTAEVSIWIDAVQRGRGVGKQLFGELIARARGLNVRVLLSKIEASNGASIRLHERFGFTKIGIMQRVGEKFGRDLDVLMMQLELPTEL